jgi:hypothetical protein
VPTSIIVLIVVIVVLLAIIAGLAITMASRRKKLQERFGPEYDRLVTESDSRRLAEAELTERERRVKKLDLRELSAADRQRYLGQWTAVQERFVDDPTAAIAEGQHLVEAVMRDRGYPVAEYHQTLADLSVEHAQLLDHVRQAHDISDKAKTGRASTEEERVAMLHYRELFADLLGDQTVTSATASTAGTTTAAESTNTAGPAVSRTTVPQGTANDDDIVVLPDDDPALDEDAEAERLPSGTSRRARR